ncbi:polysaccharide export protein [Dactylonectria macrodidyma]|uniref:Polysaccharide export protein n=1 Tax=Dactylonectria macrodidyma TaxID=307937 RepID=A0A9P9DB71_9HYPO|nr:polysaccharide export protein [Dactylonectria macrodidyma]
MAQDGIAFDYVLLLNDVVFTVADVLALLNTNNGNYAAACSMDFSNPPQYYDTFALRDTAGHEHATHTWPYFYSSQSRSAMKRSQPVPVTSCWNGMGALSPSASPSPPRKIPAPLCTLSNHLFRVASLYACSSFYWEQAISFRGIDDTLAESHLEASECCLIHIDNLALVARGVFLNPNVRVGYTSQAYDLVHPSGSWVTYLDIFIGQWTNRLSRWFSVVWIKEWIVLRRERKWEKQSPHRKERGTLCLINEMQVLVSNGWAHV